MHRRDMNNMVISDGNFNTDALFKLSRPKGPATSLTKMHPSTTAATIAFVLVVIIFF
jgi:hypothetical protein